MPGFVVPKMSLGQGCSVYSFNGALFVVRKLAMGQGLWCLKWHWGRVCGT